MNYLLTLFTLVISNTYDISVSQIKCTCPDINYENDCSYLNSTCTWNGTNCNFWDCSEIESLDLCTTANSCAWKNNSCETFTQCSDYSSIDAPCDIQGTGCDQSEEKKDGGGFICVDQIKNITTIGICSTYRNNESCLGTGIGCYWTGGYCRILKCTDFTSNDECLRVYSENYQTVQICNWTPEGTCELAQSLEVLNQENCISLSSRRATWNSTENQCTLCSSFSIIIISLTSIFWF